MKKSLKYLSFILFINIFVFLFLETLLHLFNLFPAPRFFKERKDDRGRTWAQYKYGMLKPEFLKNKGNNTYRIVSFGGSTTMGSPYYPKSSFSRMLELALNKSAPAKTVEVINLGASGMNSLEVLYCLREALKYKPDLAVIYLGQNEFFAASLFSDWRHPYLNQILDVLRLHSHIYQALKYSDKILTLLPAAIGTNQEITEKINLGFDQLPMENRPMSREFYNDRIKSYRYHLDQILAALRRNKVPVLICTVAVNLKDWPPEWMPFPEKLNEPQKNQLKNDLYGAYLDISDGKPDTAEPKLEKARPLSSEYAQYFFIRGWMDETKGDFQSARDNFLSARKFDNSRHRAPPEIDPIIRELAPKHQAILVDIEDLFFKESRTTPGFDLFEDHVHPNLMGQRLIARKLYRAIIDNKMINLNNALPEFPSEDEFKSAFGIDEKFLDEVKFKLALYYLLQRRLPERDRQTIGYLTQVFSRHPDNTLAGLCLASILLEQSREPDALQVLAQAVKSAGGIDQFQKILLRYFFPKIIMQGNYLLIHLNLDPANPPLRGIMLVRAAPEQTKKRSGLPLDQYQWIFQYHPESQSFEDITESALATLKSAKTACAPGAEKEIDLLNLFRLRPGLFVTNDLAIIAQGKNLVLKLSGNDPWFYFPAKLEPASARKILINISVQPENPINQKCAIELFWSDSQNPVFSEGQKISWPNETDGKFQTIEIKLSENLNWLASKPIFFLRLDPGNAPGRAEIRKFAINVCSDPAGP